MGSTIHQSGSAGNVDGLGCCRLQLSVEAASSQPCSSCAADTPCREGDRLEPGCSDLPTALDAPPVASGAHSFERFVDRHTVGMGLAQQCADLGAFEGDGRTLRIVLVVGTDEFGCFDNRIEVPCQRGNLGERRGTFDHQPIDVTGSIDDLPGTCHPLDITRDLTEMSPRCPRDLPEIVDVMSTHGVT